MLHRYDISLDEDANRLSIKEFAVIGPKLRKSEYYDRANASIRLFFPHSLLGKNYG
ncbi:MAG: hypothetical protein P8185_24485 [Deltaproteobacteria bacterium]